MAESPKSDVGVFVVIPDPSARILVVRHNYPKEVDPSQRQWSLPGGGLDRGELVTDAAIREVKEETGFDIVLSDLIGIFSKRKGPGCVVLFTGELLPSAPSEYDKKEIMDIGFFCHADLAGLDLYGAQRGLIQAYFSRAQEWFVKRKPVYDFMIPPLT